MQAASATSAQPNAWKGRRRCTEWRIRWLELRLRELKYQQGRYEKQLEQLSMTPNDSVGAKPQVRAQHSARGVPIEAGKSLPPKKEVSGSS